MSSVYTPEALNALKKQVSESMASAFNIMFNMDLFSFANTSEPVVDRDVVKAFVEIKGGENSSVLNIAIPKKIVGKIAESLLPDSGLDDAQMQQDIVCEIANIIGHTIRDYVIEKTGEELVVELPQHGNVSKETSQFDIITLQPLGETKACGYLDFLYLRSA